MVYDARYGTAVACQIPSLSDTLCRDADLQKIAPTDRSVAAAFSWTPCQLVLVVDSWVRMMQAPLRAPSE